MPRCDHCHRQRASADVRKLPGRDAHRCKDKFACLLAEMNSEPYTIVMEITVPAKTMKEARQIGIELASNKGQILPMEMVEVRDKDGNKYDGSLVREAVLRTQTGPSKAR